MHYLGTLFEKIEVGDLVLNTIREGRCKNEKMIIRQIKDDMIKGSLLNGGFVGDLRFGTSGEDTKRCWQILLRNCKLLKKNYNKNWLIKC